MGSTLRGVVPTGRSRAGSWGGPKLGPLGPDLYFFFLDIGISFDIWALHLKLKIQYFLMAVPIWEINEGHIFWAWHFFSDFFSDLTKVMAVNHKGHGFSECASIAGGRFKQHFPEVPLGNTISQDAQIENGPHKGIDIPSS